MQYEAVKMDTKVETILLVVSNRGTRRGEWKRYASGKTFCQVGVYLGAAREPAMPNRPLPPIEQGRSLRKQEAILVALSESQENMLTKRLAFHRAQGRSVDEVEGTSIVWLLESVLVGEAVEALAIEADYKERARQ